MSVYFRNLDHLLLFYDSLGQKPREQIRQIKRSCQNYLRAYASILMLHCLLCYFIGEIQLEKFEIFLHSFRDMLSILTFCIFGKAKKGHSIMSWRKKIRICSLQGETNEPHFSLWKKIPWHFFKLLELFARVYGVEHLLRLFTKLPVILGQVSMASVEASQLQTNLSDFLKYLQKNAGSMFSGSHAIPAADSFEIRRWCEDWKSSIDFLATIRVSC